MAGERIWNLIRLFNVREGFSRKQDNLPERVFNDPLSSGIAKGKILPRADFEKMLDEYYALRGWSDKGIPTQIKCQELGLEEFYTKIDQEI
jgi:aldehyde:ferredoxin oxidoreductase